MMADEARSFSTFSVGNAVAVAMARPCGCEPYADVFTFRRWIAQGFVVRRGEKAIKIPVVVEREADEEGAEPVRLLRTSAVFCRCQLAELGGAA